MIEYPEHLGDCVKNATGRFAGDVTNEHRYYQLVCSCGDIRFTLWESNRKSVLAECASCKRRTIVYDLAFYPAAVKLPGAENYARLASQKCIPSEVFVLYEYGTPEDDMDFNRNDITWCQIFVVTESGKLETVFDDETC